MGSGSKGSFLCLRWNGNEIRLSDAFQELRTNSDFFDITIGCADIQGVRSVKAHRVILSAYSDVFKEIFQQYGNQSDPFLFLKGVSYTNLSAIIEFMYVGEVNIKEVELETFLSVAKEFKCKGLTSAENEWKDGLDTLDRRSQSYKENIDIERPTRKNLIKDEPGLPTSSADTKPYKELKTTDRPARTNLKRNYAISSEDEEVSKTVSKTPKIYTKQNPLVDWTQKLDNTIELHNSNVRLNENLFNYRNNDKNTDMISQESTGEHVGPVESFIANVEKRETEQDNAHKYRKFAKCTICEKVGRFDNLKMHIRKVHPSYIS